MKKRISKVRLLPVSRIPAVIPPKSLVILAQVDERLTPDWIADRGRIFRIGFYSRQDGLDCIWLVNTRGEYEQTVDRQGLLDHFLILKLSDEADLYGERRKPLQALPRAERPSETLARAS